MKKINDVDIPDLHETDSDSENEGTRNKINGNENQIGNDDDSTKEEDDVQEKEEYFLMYDSDALDN